MPFKDINGDQTESLHLQWRVCLKDRECNALLPEYFLMAAVSIHKYYHGQSAFIVST